MSDAAPQPNLRLQNNPFRKFTLIRTPGWAREFIKRIRMTHDMHVRLPQTRTPSTGLGIHQFSRIN